MIAYVLRSVSGVQYRIVVRAPTPSPGGRYANGGIHLVGEFSPSISADIHQKSSLPFRFDTGHKFCRKIRSVPSNILSVEGVIDASCECMVK